MADARDLSLWEVHARQIEAGEASLPPEVMKALTEIAQSFTDRRVLDIGCGIGLFSELFDSCSYVGIDQSNAMLERARRIYPDKKFILGNGRSLPFKDASFNLVFTRAVVQHNWGDDKLKVISEITRLVSPGGYYLFSEGDFLTGPYDLDKVKALLPEFELVDSRYDTIHLFLRR